MCDDALNARGRILADRMLSETDDSPSMCDEVGIFPLVLFPLLVSAVPIVAINFNGQMALR